MWPENEQIWKTAGILSKSMKWNEINRDREITCWLAFNYYFTVFIILFGFSSGFLFGFSVSHFFIALLSASFSCCLALSFAFSLPSSTLIALFLLYLAICSAHFSFSSHFIFLLVSIRSSENEIERKLGLSHFKNLHSHSMNSFISSAANAPRNQTKSVVKWPIVDWENWFASFIIIKWGKKNTQR